MTQNRQSTKMYIVHRNTLLDSFWRQIVWFQPKEDSDRIRISFFKNRIGSDSENPLIRSSLAHASAVISVEHDPVSRSQSNRILQFRTGSDWISRKLNRIRYGFLNCVDHCSQMLNQRVFSDINRIGSNISTGLPD